MKKLRILLIALVVAAIVLRMQEYVTTFRLITNRDLFTLFCMIFAANALAEQTENPSENVSESPSSEQVNKMKRFVKKQQLQIALGIITLLCCLFIFFAIILRITSFNALKDWMSNRDILDVTFILIGSVIYYKRVKEPAEFPS